jgi:hypothetical protein
MNLFDLKKEVDAACSCADRSGRTWEEININLCLHTGGKIRRFKTYGIDINYTPKGFPAQLTVGVLEDSEVSELPLNVVNDKFIGELSKSIEFHRTNKNDPYGIGAAVSTSLSEVRRALTEALKVRKSSASKGTTTDSRKYRSVLKILDLDFRPDSHCHRCGKRWKADRLGMEDGMPYCPDCSDHRDIHASLSVVEPASAYEAVGRIKCFPWSSSNSNHAILAAESVSPDGPFSFLEELYDHVKDEPSSDDIDVLIKVSQHALGGGNSDGI